MISSIRQEYNRLFTQEKYAQFLQSINNTFYHSVSFRVAETPVFVDRDFKQKLITASEEIIDFLTRSDFKKLTDTAIPDQFYVPGESDHTLFLALDFAVTKNEQGELQPALIEMQGFPSLFGFQDFIAAQYRKYFYCPDHFTNHFAWQQSYKENLRRIILNGHEPENVVLLEIDPLKQNTAIDFVATRQMTGITLLNIADVVREGRILYYKGGNRKIQIHRIYSRVIFDELAQRKDLYLSFTLTEEVDVEWAGHPNWFFRISKFTMPLIKSQFIPECNYLNSYHRIPPDLENYVLKPLFSFSGSGVIFNVSQSDIDSIPASERHNYLLQRKVNYEPVIKAPDGNIKTEIRLLFIWEDNQPKPTLVTNLARLSRGEMIGVKFNKDKTWVGSSVCFFE